MHLDLEYEVGALASCDSFLCCRAESYTEGDVNVRAGEWGSNYGLCDIPMKTFESMMNYIVEEVQPDIIFWTGDNSSHNTWNNTLEEITHYSELVTNMIKDAI